LNFIEYGDNKRLDYKLFNGQGTMCSN